MNTPTDPLEAEILEVWHREFDPEHNPPMPVTLFEDLKALIHTREQQARIDELQKASDVFDTMHQKTEGGGFVHYGEFGEYIDERLATLNKEQE